MTSNYDYLEVGSSNCVQCPHVGEWSNGAKQRDISDNELTAISSNCYWYNCTRNNYLIIPTGYRCYCTLQLYSTVVRWYLIVPLNDCFNRKAVVERQQYSCRNTSICRLTGSQSEHIWGIFEKQQTTWKGQSYHSSLKRSQSLLVYIVISLM